MLQGIILSEKAIENIENISITSLHPGNLIYFYFFSLIFNLDGSHTHVFLEGHHTGITIPLKQGNL